MRTDPTAPAPPGSERRRLYRRTDDKVIAGVASGLGDYFRVDPVLFRIGFVALAFAGGVGIILYGVAWLVMPPSYGGPSHGEDALRRVGSGRLATWVAVVLLVIGAGLLVDALGFHEPDLVWGGVLIALGVLLFRHATTKDEEEALVPPVPPPPPVGAAAVAAPGLATEAPPPPTTMPLDTAPTEPTSPVPRRRHRSTLGLLTFGTMFLALGGAILLDNADIVSLSLSQYFALALLVLAAGLVVGAWIGRARWLAIPALLLVPAVVMSGLVDVPLEGGFGDRFYQPVAISGGPSPYRLIAGRMTLDLTDVGTLKGDTTITATILAGELRVIAPPHVTLVVHSQIGAGEMDLFGHQSNGLKLDQVVTSRRPGEEFLRLDLAVSFGRIFVSRG